MDALVDVTSSVCVCVYMYAWGGGNVPYTGYAVFMAGVFIVQRMLRSRCHGDRSEI